MEIIGIIVLFILAIINIISSIYIAKNANNDLLDKMLKNKDITSRVYNKYKM